MFDTYMYIQTKALLWVELPDYSAVGGRSVCGQVKGILSYIDPLDFPYTSVKKIIDLRFYSWFSEFNRNLEETLNYIARDGMSGFCKALL